MRNKTKIILSLGLFVIVISQNSCTDSTTDVLELDSPVVKELKSRVAQITDISWTPKGEIPSNAGSYTFGYPMKGIPYSSVKEEEKFVGQYVSFYTFKTAVANPKSVLYTENVREAPYHGTNCSSYYGTVCSMAVNYALGLPYSFTTSSYKNLSCFYMVEPQAIDVAEPGDILLQESKHVVMIIDIKKTRDRISLINILESSGGSGTRIDSYTLEDLQTRWNRDGWELLRYRDLDKLTEVDAMSFNNYPYDTPFISPMCCSRGDRACFREGEEIVLNNLDGKHHAMKMLSDNRDIDYVVSDGLDISINSLLPGIYTFDLETSGWDNPSVEVLDTNVNAERQDDELAVSFSSSNSKPMSVIISNQSGGHYLVQPITDEERAAGQIVVKIPKRSGQMYLKVMFEGTYGSVSNEPIAI